MSNSHIELELQSFPSSIQQETSMQNPKAVGDQAFNGNNRSTSNSTSSSSSVEEEHTAQGIIVSAAFPERTGSGQSYDGSSTTKTSASLREDIKLDVNDPVNQGIDSKYKQTIDGAGAFFQPTSPESNLTLVLPQTGHIPPVTIVSQPENTSTNEDHMPFSLDQLELIPHIPAFALTQAPQLHYSISDHILGFFGIQDEGGTRWHETMHPNSYFVTLWEIFQALFLAYIAVLLPFRIGFESELACEENVVKFDLFLDLFFIVDIMLQFFIGYKKFGQVETERKKVVKHYLKGGFAFDVVISLPVTWIQFAWTGVLCLTHNNSSAFAAARLLRLLRLIRVIRAVKLFSLSLFERLPFSQFALQMLKLVVASLFCAHIAACAYWYVKSMDPYIERFLIEQNLDNTGVGDKYVASLYFAGTMLSTVGFGDIHGENTIERIYCIITMLLGAGVFATVISSISALVAGNNSKNQSHQRRMRELNDFIKRYDVPAVVAKKLRTYYFHNFQIDDVSTSMSWVREVPIVIRNDLCNHLAKEILGKCELFKDAPKEHITSIFLALRPYHVASGETILQAGQRGTEMYIIHKGLVKMQYPENAGFRLLHPGDVFGENAILSSNPHETRPVTCVAAEFCELYVLQKSDVLAGMLPYEKMKARFEKFVRSRRNEIIAKLNENQLKLGIGSWSLGRRVMEKAKGVMGKLGIRTPTNSVDTHGFSFSAGRNESKPNENEIWEDNGSKKESPASPIFPRNSPHVKPMEISWKQTVTTSDVSFCPKTPSAAQMMFVENKEKMSFALNPIMAAVNARRFDMATPMASDMGWDIAAMTPTPTPSEDHSISPHSNPRVLLRELHGLSVIACRTLATLRLSHTFEALMLIQRSHDDTHLQHANKLENIINRMNAIIELVQAKMY